MAPGSNGSLGLLVVEVLQLQQMLKAQQRLGRSAQVKVWASRVDSVLPAGELTRLLQQAQLPRH